MRTLGFKQRFCQISLVAFTVLAAARARAEIGALTLEPLSMTAFSEKAPAPLATAFASSAEIAAVPTNNEPAIQFVGPASSPDFATTVQSMDATDYFGFEQVVAPVPEPSTWLAASLAGLVMLWALRKKLRFQRTN